MASDEMSIQMELDKVVIIQEGKVGRENVNMGKKYVCKIDCKIIIQGAYYDQRTI